MAKRQDITRRRVRHDNEADNFFEVMPLTLSPHAIYRDDVVPEVPLENQANSAAAKRLAVRILVGVALASLLLGWLLVMAIQALQG